jgi:hypothetical protein
LKLDEFQKRVMPRGWEEVPWVLMIARQREPSSEMHIAEQWYSKIELSELLELPAPRVDDNRLSRALNELLPHKAERETHLRERLGELFDLEYDLLLYDVTSAFFEC